MTQREICEWIVEHEGCFAADFFCDENCPLYTGKFACEKFDSEKEAAQAWLEANREDV